MEPTDKQKQAGNHPNHTSFKKIIWTYFKTHGRKLPWRNTRDPYKILVSEIMLQQTQAPRVIPKYKAFLKKFPTVHTLANASLSEVLKEWQGLGYNRRAKYLKECAEVIEQKYNGKFPKDFNELCTLPGIGPATAGDICAFAWNIPVVLIETNVRSVFLHFFFKGKENVHDKEILPLIEKTLDTKNPREWYVALFDYGTFLKQTKNPNVQSKHYIKQSPFKGSNREKRSNILKLILTKPRTENELVKLTQYEKDIVHKNLAALVKERMIIKKGNKFCVI